MKIPENPGAISESKVIKYLRDMEYSLSMHDHIRSAIDFGYQAAIREFSLKGEGMKYSVEDIKKAFEAGREEEVLSNDGGGQIHRGYKYDLEDYLQGLSESSDVTKEKNNQNQKQ